MNKARSIYVYQMAPIDYWVGWQPLQSYISFCVTNMNPGDVHGGLAMKILNRYQAALRHAMLDLKWPGDFKDGPYITANLSHDMTEEEFLLGWKEDNNGNTYIVSRGEFQPFIGREDVCSLTSFKLNEEE